MGQQKRMISWSGVWLGRGMSKKTWKRLAAGYLIIFYLLPSAGLLPAAGLPLIWEQWLLRLIFPAAVLAAGIIIGYFHEICLLYSVFAGGQFFLCGALFGFQPVWEYALEFFIIGFCANTAVYLFRSTKTTIY